MRFQTVVLVAVVFAADRDRIGATSYGGASMPTYASHSRNEVRRLQAHFDSVDLELVSRDVASLRPDQRSARLDLITWLREYRNAGVFPLNNGFAKQAAPIFRDRRGVLCAMAYLMARSGRPDIVEEIAHTNNLALISDLAEEPRLVGWLDSVGLSLGEASRIQPTYQPPPGTVFKDDAVSATYAIASMLVSGTAIGTGFLNVAKPTTIRGWTGLIAGAGATTLGLVHLDGSSAATTRVAIANMVIGTAAAVLGLRSLLRSAHTEAERNTGNHRRMTVAPVILQVQNASQPGIGVYISF